MAEGNVARTAVVLGLARNNLYKRLASLGIDPIDYRGNSALRALATPRALATQSTASASTREGSEGNRSAPLSSTVILTGPPGGAILTRVTSTATAIEEGTTERPKRLRMTRSFYLRPDQVKAIDDACLDLPAVLREQMSPSKVMERFHDDCFADWLQRTKDGAQPPRRIKKNGATK